ncbi:MAG: diguanylate cyclase [Enterobacterales bacterium]|nr:diguanylate cyclase [Enterobacterales bacterium]
MKKKVLLVEDSTLVVKVMCRLIIEQNEFEADFALTFADAVKLIGDNPDKYFAAVVDLNLPDAPKGEVVDLVLKNKIPTIVLTASYDEKKRDSLIAKGIVDYVIKENRFSYSYALKLITRINRNHDIKVMVVDDSLVARKQCANLLKKYLFQVYRADGAKQAIRHLVDNPDIRLVITDYNMPEIDGFELVKLLRGKYDKQDLTIIGLSGDENATLSAKFIIQNGANDFLRKPFIQEEFYCRIMHNIESLEAIEQIKDAANRDYLTGLYNRRYFCEQAEHKIKSFQKSAQNYSMAIIEVDNFKEFNNVYHSYGDQVVQVFSDAFKRYFGQDFSGRLNGTEFVVLQISEDQEEAYEKLDAFRKLISEIKIKLEDQEKGMTISIGLKFSQQDELTDLLKNCDDLLQRAQDAGQNIVLYD